VAVDGVPQGALTEYTFHAVHEDHTIAASFATKTYTIAASAGAGGVIVPAGDVTVECAADQHFSIAADPGHDVLDVLVDGVSVGADTAYTFHDVIGPHTIAASFSARNFTVTATATGRGGVTKTPDQPTYAYGATVELAPAPAPGWAFTGWSGDTTTTGVPLALFMIRDWAVTAAFADTAPPSVHLTWPVGGEHLGNGSLANVAWTASDNEVVADVDLYLSRTGPGGPFDSLATHQPNSGSWAWTVDGPATADAYVRVVARDSAANTAMALSDSAFAILASSGVEGGTVTAFALGTVRPNPARGSCRVSFDVPRAAPVRVSIVDVQGRVVTVLADGEQPAGRHEVTWRNGTHARPGLYFVRMTAEGRTHLQRFVLIR
jgi:hypothetical protein